jgi:hypothetical protein
MGIKRRLLDTGKVNFYFNKISEYDPFFAYIHLKFAKTVTMSQNKFPLIIHYGYQKNAYSFADFKVKKLEQEHF